MEDGTAQKQTYTYQTITPTPAQILTPSTTAPLSHSDVTFTWDQGIYVRQYAICAIWDAANPYPNGGVCSDFTTSLTATLRGIQITGRPITVDLYSVMEDGTPQKKTYTYQTSKPSSGGSSKAQKITLD